MQEAWLTIKWQTVDHKRQSKQVVRKRHVCQAAPLLLRMQARVSVAIAVDPPPRA